MSFSRLARVQLLGGLLPSMEAEMDCKFQSNPHEGFSGNRKLEMFGRLVWQRDRMLLDDLVFRLEDYQSPDWNGGDHFRFYKMKEVVEQYESFFSRRSDFRPKRVIELGIYDGGSTAFWYELFRPQKYVALDIQDQTDPPYFRRYVESRGLGGRIKTYWNTDQANKARLRTIVETEFEGPSRSGDR
jgi:hypothetical protein